MASLKEIDTRIKSTKKNEADYESDEHGIKFKTS